MTRSNRVFEGATDPEPATLPPSPPPQPPPPPPPGPDAFRRGSFGENAAHLVALRRGATPEGLAIVKHLVKVFGPRLVNAPLQERRCASDAPGAYEGETLLHIALVVGSFTLVKHLVEQGGADVRARAWGPFFRMGGKAFYGEYPLHFAVALRRKKSALYLAAAGARVLDRDSHGNSALHVAVFHRLPGMLDLLLDSCCPPGEPLAAWQDEAAKAVNGAGLTPLTLAASLGDLALFEHLLRRQRKVKWKYGPVTSFSLALEDIDTRPPEQQTHVSALQVTVDAGHLHILRNDLVGALAGGGAPPQP